MSDPHVLRVVNSLPLLDMLVFKQSSSSLSLSLSLSLYFTDVGQNLNYYRYLYWAAAENSPDWAQILDTKMIGKWLTALESSGGMKSSSLPKYVTAMEHGILYWEHYGGMSALSHHPIHYFSFANSQMFFHLQRVCSSSRIYLCFLASPSQLISAAKSDIAVLKKRYGRLKAIRRHEIRREMSALVTLIPPTALGEYLRDINIEEK